MFAEDLRFGQVRRVLRVALHKFQVVEPTGKSDRNTKSIFCICHNKRNNMCIMLLFFFDILDQFHFEYWTLSNIKYLFFLTPFLSVVSPTFHFVVGQIFDTDHVCLLQTLETSWYLKPPKQRNQKYRLFNFMFHKKFKTI